MCVYVRERTRASDIDTHFFCWLWDPCRFPVVFVVVGWLQLWLMLLVLLLKVFVALVLLFKPNFVLPLLLLEDVVWCAINSAPRLTRCARRAELKLSPPPPPHELGALLLPPLRFALDFIVRKGVPLPDKCKWCSMFSCSANSGWSSLWWLCKWWWCKLFVVVVDTCERCCCWWCWLLDNVVVELLLTTKGVATSTCAELLLSFFYDLWF